MATRRPPMRAKGPGPKTRVQLRRALRQRAANVRAAAAGLSLPHPNPWDALDPTKLPRDATPEQIQARYAEFRKLCPPPRRKQHFL